MIIPGILEETFEEIERKVAVVDKFAKRIQIDFADSLVVANTFMDVTRLDDLDTNVPIEIHLLVENPENFVAPALLKVKFACAQIEAKKHIRGFLRNAKENLYITGLSIGPDTPLHELEPYVKDISYVQFMTIKPGGQGRSFIETVLPKIKDFKKLHPHMPLQVDGSINAQTIDKVIQLGVENFIVGSAIVKAEDPQKAFEELKEKDEAR